MTATARTMWMRKYSKLPGRFRFDYTWVQVEVMRAEDKVTTEAVRLNVPDPERTAKMGFPCSKWVETGTIKEYREPGFIVREKGKKAKWVEAGRLFEERS